MEKSFKKFTPRIPENMHELFLNMWEATFSNFGFPENGRIIFDEKTETLSFVSAGNAVLTFKEQAIIRFYQEEDLFCCTELIEALVNSAFQGEADSFEWDNKTLSFITAKQMDNSLTSEWYQFLASLDLETMSFSWSFSTPEQKRHYNTHFGMDDFLNDYFSECVSRIFKAEINNTYSILLDIQETREEIKEFKKFKP